MTQKLNRPNGEERRYARSLANLEGALGRFRDQAVRLGADERTRAVALLLKAAHELLRIRFVPVPGNAAIGMYLDELADDAGARPEDDPATS
jgi:hypothetical protein